MHIPHMHRMWQSMRDDLVLYGWLVAVVALCLSGMFLYFGLGGEAATAEQYNAAILSMGALGASTVVLSGISITNKHCWWSGFVYAGAPVALCFAVYGVYAVRP